MATGTSLVRRRPRSWCSGSARFVLSGMSEFVAPSHRHITVFFIFCFFLLLLLAASKVRFGLSFEGGGSLESSHAWGQEAHPSFSLVEVSRASLVNTVTIATRPLSSRP